MRKLAKSLVLGYVCVASGVYAGDISQLKSMVDAGKYEEAYEFALANLDEYEGDPAFDQQYGVAAIDSGNISEGVFALERVLLLEPQNSLAKLELARGYFQLGQYEKARLLFNQVKKLNPPSNVQARISQYLALIEKKTIIQPTRFNSFVELWAGYDSNINSGPDAQTNVVILSDSALGRGDMYTQVRAGASVEHAYSPEGVLNFSINADLRYYDTEPEQDYRNITVSAGHTWNLDQQQYQLNFVAQQYSLDYEDYRDLLGVSLGWNRQLSRNSVLKTYLGFNQLTYDTLDWKDSTQINLGATYLYGGAGSWSPVFFAGAFIGQEEPETAGVLANAEVDRIYYGGNLGVQFTPVKDLTFTPALTYQASDYQGEDWIYGVKREDDFALFNLNLTWTLQKSWALLANYSYTYADSNIELYEYDRQQVMLGLRYNFQ